MSALFLRTFSSAAIASALVVLPPGVGTLRAQQAFLTVGDVRPSRIPIQRVEASLSTPSGSPSDPSGAGVGRTEFSSVLITKARGAGTIELFQAAAQGRHFPKVVIEFGASGSITETMTLTDVVVTSLRRYTHLEAGRSQELEDVGFLFGRIEVKRMSDGLVGCWDLQRAARC